METIFSFLFKYNVFYFSEGQFGFRNSVPLWWVVVGFFVGAGVFLFLYRRSLAAGDRRFWVLPALRIGFLVVVCLLLLKPTLTLSRLVPQQSILMILVDNSASMGILEEEQPRGDQIKELFDDGSEWLESLAERFHLRRFSFDRAARIFEDSSDLDWGGDRTRIVDVLDRSVTEAKSLPVGGVVLITDGADNGSRELEPVLDELRARQIPVHTVGVGPERLERDVELVSISGPRRMIPDSVGLYRVVLRHSGVAGESARLLVRENGALVEAREVQFPSGTDMLTTEIKVFPRSQGTKVYELEITDVEGELLLQNNKSQTVVEIESTTPRILHVEGRPRWDYKFLRQALAQDEYLRLESLLRTALNKYYRQGIEQESTLASGFPTTREELFDYEAVLLGDVESAFFTYGQMELMRDFVGRRGGGLLMMGGTYGFGQGGFENTPLEEVLPVWLEADLRAYQRGEATVSLTAFGANHPALQLDSDEAASRQAWNNLPRITDWNLVGPLKPGATQLASLGVGGEGPTRPLLVSQRYGRGLGVAFLTGSSWRWQMLQDHSDLSHETFWRQLLRWLTTSARRRLAIETDQQVYASEDHIRLRAELNDASFNGINAGQVKAEIRGPSGQPQTIALEWNGKEDGVYEGTWTAGDSGMYRVELAADAVDADVGSANGHFLVTAGDVEYYDPVQKVDFLRRLAQETGGRYYPVSQMERLPQEVSYVESEASIVEVLDLWDMPINLLLLVGLLGTEWILRKRWGGV
jgi:uncharacterized membrane protein